jgi:alpha-tubulin suppressor-like RCC1 family protein
MRKKHRFPSKITHFSSKKSRIRCFGLGAKVLLVLLGDRLKTKVSHMEVFDDLNCQI